MSAIEYLEDERKKLWEAVTELKKDLKSKSSESEHEAKQSSKKISEYKNKSLHSKEQIDLALFDSTSSSEKINALLLQIQENSIAIEKIHERASSFSDHLDTIEQKTKIIDELYSNQENLNEKIETLEEIHKTGSETSSKITATYNNLIKRKKEIDDLYFEIMGYEIENEDTGEITKEEGIKDNLEQAYTQIKNEIDSLKKDMLIFKKEESEKYKNELENNRENLKGRINLFEDEYNKATQKIKSLLPDALTAGLSHAFSEKRQAEIKEGEKLSTSFSRAILGLVCVSLVPFIINIYLLHTGKSLESTINDTPRIVLAILPLYIPFLWLAYFSNKRINLSKRLTEEYTHKEVLSKTFEGLSNQIESVENKEMSEELRIKLLYNILDVSSENPGKLISDYNKADHPVMDVLEKSFKLSNAVDSLKKIPGMKKVAKIIEHKATDALEIQAKKIESAIESVTD